MNWAVREPMSLGEFLAWEREQELRYEFDGFQPVAMTGGTLEHSAIASNIYAALRSRLAGGACRAFRGDVKVIVAGHVRYPDVVVTCSPHTPGADIVPEPVVVFEVLSKTTARIDRTVKNAEYRDTASIRHYVILEQEAAAATIFSRSGKHWSGELVIGINGVLNLGALGVELPLSEVYADIELSDDAPDD